MPQLRVHLKQECDVHPGEFAAKWQIASAQLSEKAAAQEHWRDLCALLGEPTPSSDPTGDLYTFEKHVKKAGTGETGYADVFKRDCFIGEYKGKGKSLGKALQQALLYARELGNPPLLFVSDLETIEVHTNFTGSSPRRYTVTLDDIARDAKVDHDLTALGTLRAMFREPGRLDPRLVRERITSDATAKVGQVAQSLAARGVPQTQAAHFLMRIIFAMFAEDVGLLERGLLTKVLRRARDHPEKSQSYFQELFAAMQAGGEFWGVDIRHFNGGLFDDSLALAITVKDADALYEAATLNWAEVEPAIFGTLFENSLDRATRGKRGAHYTSVPDILRIVEPVVMDSLRQEWQEAKADAEKVYPKKNGSVAAIERLRVFQERLATVRVLDPACGSGNFLVVTLGLLLDLEHEVRSLAFVMGAGDFAFPPRVHPRQLLGIEIEPFAQELASVSVWISYFQWKRAHGGQWETPVLQRLHTIENRDALLTLEGGETRWPAAEFIVGNPPFLGDKKMRAGLGLGYVDQLRDVYSGRVPGGADLVTYWLEKARSAIEIKDTRRAGFVTTNSVRGGQNRKVLERVKASGDIFMAWPDEPWVQNGAAVRVSLLAFDDGTEKNQRLNGSPVATINADLSARADVNMARPLADNAGMSFVGGMKKGKFDISGDLARQWLKLPNLDGVSNADVLKPWVNGMDLTRRNSDTWIIDFGTMSEEAARKYIQPFEYVRGVVKPARDKVSNELERARWWQHARTAPELREALVRLPRVIGIPRVAKHLLPVWLSGPLVVDGQVVVVARADDFAFGVLASAIHRFWSLALGTSLEDRPRYTPSTCFETFPFPLADEGHVLEVEKWSRYVVQIREHLLRQDSKATLTGLYNDLVQLREKPDATHAVSALVTAHDHLDLAVAAAYGWEWPLEEGEVLSRLLALNLDRQVHVELK
jgi:type II restriction/modification system DNA methylase subunit YeeA